MPDRPDSQTLRVASYNMRKARGLDGRRDPGRIVDVINGLEADVITLQEADRRLGDRPSALPRDLIDSATDFEVAPLARNSVSLGWHGNAVLLRKGLKIDSAMRIALPGVEPRGAVAVTLSDGLTVVGVHLGLLRRSRRQQLARIAQKVAGMGPAVIIGDMNEWSATRGFEPLRHAFDLHTPGRSFHAARPLAALDRLALGAGVSLTDAGVAQDALARQASDHLPIWADLRYLQNSTGSVASFSNPRVAAPITKS